MVRYLVVFTLDEMRVEMAMQSHLRAGHLLTEVAQVEARPTLKPVGPICRCGDPRCDCGCLPGNYPCEHGSMGEGCGS